MASTNFEVTRHVISFRGRRIEGFAEGTLVSIKRDTPLSTKMVGVDGLGMWATLHDRSATIEMTLMPNAPIAGYLAACAELGSAGEGVLSIEDLDGNLLATAASARITEYPEVTLEKDISPRKWMFQALDLSIRPGPATT